MQSTCRKADWTLALMITALTAATPTLAAEFAPVPGLLGMTEMRAVGVSADGQAVVGTVHTGGTVRAFSWRVGELLPTLLTDLPGAAIRNEARAISADGKVVAGSGESPLGVEAVIWSGGPAPTGLGDLADGFYASNAAALSTDGTYVVGTGHSTAGREAFRWTSSEGMQPLGFLPLGLTSEAIDISADGDVVVGVSETFDAILGEAFYWTPQDGMVGLGDLPGGDVMSRAKGTSSSGNVVVGVSSSLLGDEAFRWTADTSMQGLGDLPGGSFSSVAYDVTDDASRVIGAATTDSALSVAFLWTTDAGMRPLAEVLIDDFGMSAELAGWDLLSAQAMTPDGQFIVGTGIDPNGHVRAWRASLDPVQARSGDTNGDGLLDVNDLNLLQKSIHDGIQAAKFDLSRDGQVDLSDQEFWVHEIRGTYFGDADLDGQFGSRDLVKVFVAGEYEDTLPQNSTWETGDWNADLEFSSADIIRAFIDGGYEQGMRPARATPEPISSFPLLFACGWLFGQYRLRRTNRYR